MRILLAVDGSVPSQDAVDEVARRSWPAGSHVRVIAVVRPYAPLAMEHISGLQEILQQQTVVATQIAERAAERLTQAGLSVDMVVRQGDPRAVIVDEAAEWGADLVAIGSHGHTGLARLVLGSVAQAVVVHAPCSVEVVRKRRD